MRSQIMKKRNNKQTTPPKQERPATSASAGSEPTNVTNVAVPLEEVQKRAYAIFETRGGTPGHELDDWLLAEAEIRTKLAIAPSNKAHLSQQG